MDNKERTEGYFKNVLSLAYLGDAVFTLMVRNFLIESSNVKPNMLNKKANSVVCARAQAGIMQKIKPELLDDEIDVVMRARNSHTNNKAKNSTQEEYNLATQFEALVGYWYLNKDHEKINIMFEKYVKFLLVD